MTNLEEFQQILDAHKLFTQLRYEYWIAHEAYTALWWFLLFAWIAPWIIWWLLVDRKQLVEISFYGLVVMFITTILNAIGSVQNLWAYTVKLIPFTPHLESIDWSILPITYMLIYQYYPSWKEFLMAQTAIAILYSFIGEPFTIYILKSYLPLNWNYLYSLPIYFILAVIPRAITKLLFTIEKAAKKPKDP